MKNALAAREGVLLFTETNANDAPDPTKRPMQNEFTTNSSATPTANLQAALPHVGQAKLLLCRAAAGSCDFDQVCALHDLASVLQYLVESIEQIRGSRHV
jgi:hypothetical protein